MFWAAVALHHELDLDPAHAEVEAVRVAPAAAQLSNRDGVMRLVAYAQSALIPIDEGTRPYLQLDAASTTNAVDAATFAHAAVSAYAQHTDRLGEGRRQLFPADESVSEATARMRASLRRIEEQLALPDVPERARLGFDRNGIRVRLKEIEDTFADVAEVLVAGQGNSRADGRHQQLVDLRDMAEYVLRHPGGFRPVDAAMVGAVFTVIEDQFGWPLSFSAPTTMQVLADLGKALGDVEDNHPDAAPVLRHALNEARLLFLDSRPSVAVEAWLVFEQAMSCALGYQSVLQTEVLDSLDGLPEDPAQALGDVLSQLTADGWSPNEASEVLLAQECTRILQKSPARYLTTHSDETKHRAGWHVLVSEMVEAQGQDLQRPGVMTTLVWLWVATILSQAPDEIVHERSVGARNVLLGAARSAG